MVAFRFDANNHEYIVDGAVIPHITGMLEATGWIDDRWYTEESCERGGCVHRLTADYDLGALDVESCISKYRGWLLGHVTAMQILQPRFTHIEEPLVSDREGLYGGRPDRAGLLMGASGVLEVKSGGIEKGHPIQTALQAILVAPEMGLPPESLLRYALYLRDNGRFHLEPHDKRGDFDKARDVIRHCCGLQV